MGTGRQPFERLVGLLRLVFFTHVLLNIRRRKMGMNNGRSVRTKPEWCDADGKGRRWFSGWLGLGCGGCAFIGRRRRDRLRWTGPVEQELLAAGGMSDGSRHLLRSAMELALVMSFPMPPVP